MFIWDFVADTVMDQIVNWIYSQVVGFLGVFLCIWEIWGDVSREVFERCRLREYIRHTFCSWCFEANMQPKVVQNIMRHQYYSTTIDIYTHVTEAMYQEEVKFGIAVEGQLSEETKSGMEMMGM